MDAKSIVEILRPVPDSMLRINLGAAVLLFQTIHKYAFFRSLLPLGKNNYLSEPRTGQINLYRGSRFISLIRGRRRIRRRKDL